MNWERMNRMSKNKVFYSSIEPIDTISKGDLWYKITEIRGIELRIFDGNEWKLKKSRKGE